MDFDRDGTIGTNDVNRFDQSHPFRFWTNEDGNSNALAEVDLEDFFPAQIKWGLPPNQWVHVRFSLCLKV